MVWPGKSISGWFWETRQMLPFLLATTFIITPIMAGDLLELNVTDSQGVYRIEVDMVVHAPFENVWQVLTDYTHIYRLNASIVESEILPSPEQNVARVRTLMNDCEFIFCFEVERVEDVRITGIGKLHAVIVNELSNVKSGTALWKIQSVGDSCHIHYQGTIEPGFSVFPIIGEYFAKRKLRFMTLSTLENIEQISRINAGLEVNPESGLVFSKAP
jgi:hypothetical protein